MNLKRLKYKQWTKEEVDKWFEDNWIEGYDEDEVFKLIKDSKEVSLSMETEDNQEGDMVIVIRGQKE